MLHYILIFTIVWNKLFWEICDKIDTMQPTFYAGCYLNYPMQCLPKRVSPAALVHHDVIKLKHFPLYWPFVRRNHQSPVNSPHKGQWRGALVCYLICAWIIGWVNNREAIDCETPLRSLCRHCNEITLYDHQYSYPNITISSWYDSKSHQINMQL